MSLTIWSAFSNIKTKPDMVRYLEATIEEVKDFRDEDLQFFFAEFASLYDLAKKKGWIK